MPRLPSDTVPDSGQTGQTVAIKPVDPLLGATFGSYKVIRPLGQGGMGAVYLGEHPTIGSKVAIKVLKPAFADDEQIVERFFNEARAVNLIGHENIVQILDFNVANDRHYFVMEFLAGATLHELLQGGAAMPLARAGPIALQCCRALQAAHERGIVHRDFKPDNVFLVQRAGRADFVKLVDFGIAKLTDGGNRVRTQAGLVLGTPAYMSPEQAAGEATIDARSDVYALGVVLFQMVTGRVPFGGARDSVQRILKAHLFDPPPPPRSLAPDLPQAAERIILKALEKNPEDRFQSMAAFHDALAACMEENQLSTELPPALPAEEGGGRAVGTRSHPGSTPAPATRRARRARRWPFAAAGAVVVAAALFAIFRPSTATKPSPPVIIDHKLPPPRPPEPVPPDPTPPPSNQTTPTPPPPAPPVKKIEHVRLKLATSPESRFVASWEGGSRTGQTPRAIKVPKGAEVHIRFVKDGFQSAETAITLSKDEVVFKALTPAP